MHCLQGISRATGPHAGSSACVKHGNSRRSHQSRVERNTQSRQTTVLRSRVIRSINDEIELRTAAYFDRPKAGACRTREQATGGLRMSEREQRVREIAHRLWEEEGR